jgi:uncharacterized beta-barrel protein YwiB (DUF1934 family)
MKPVRITIKAHQKNMNDSEQVDFVTEGKFAEKGGKKYYTYMETELSGMEGVKTLIKVDESEDVVEIIRYTDHDSAMIYKLKETTESKYITPYGYMDITIHTHEMKLELDDEGHGIIYLEYYLNIMGEEMNNKVEIIVR